MSNNNDESHTVTIRALAPKWSIPPRSNPHYRTQFWANEDRRRATPTENSSIVIGNKPQNDTDVAVQ